MVSISRPARSAMQAGEAGSKHWVLEFAPRSAPFIDPLMGWTGSTDPANQVHLTFPTKDEAVAFAERHGWGIILVEPHRTRPRPHPYADNFVGQATLDQM
jgi:hypothetical protein